ncbi:LOW QUALITY PROTEIN: uncharacterized protein RB166_015379 [Leptodactylus fuscus]
MLHTYVCTTGAILLNIQLLYLADDINLPTWSTPWVAIATHNIHLRRLEEASEEHGLQSPSSVIIPAVAARLKYYFDVERREAGFDLSVNQKDSSGKHRIYQSAGRHTRHQPQRLKEYFLDNKLEASLRSYTAAGWKKKVEINRDHKQQVQRRIREDMSSFTIPERLATNYVFLRGINWKCSDWKVHSVGIVRSSRQVVSQGEFRRLISSAANLIVATTSEHDLKLLHQQKNSRSKAAGRRSLSTVCLNIPTACEESSPSIESSCLDEDSHTYYGHSGNLGLPNNQIMQASENIDYEIAVHTTTNFQEATPSMYIQLYGERSRTNRVSLQNSLANTITSSAGQAFIFHVKARDVGELTNVSIGIDKKDKAYIWYCEMVIVKTGIKKYLFPYNTWLSSCKMTKARVTGRVPTVRRAPTAKDRDTKNGQMRKNKCRSTTTKPRKKKNASCMVSSEKLELSRTQDKEEKSNDLDLKLKTNNKMLTQSKRDEGNTSQNTRTLIRKYGSSQRRPQGVPGSSMVEDHSNTVRSGNSRDQPLLGENNRDDATSNNTRSDRDLTTQNKTVSPKYRRASSPASYVFFAVETKESSLIVQVNGCSKGYTQHDTTGEKSKIVRVSSERVNIGLQCPGENKKYPSFEKGSSELALLQEILSDAGNNVTSASLDSHLFSSSEKTEGKKFQHGADNNDGNGVHGDLPHLSDRLCSKLDCEAKRTSMYSCSCEDLSSYETDSTLDEEYIFSDTSLDLSLSDDDSDSSFRSDIVYERPEYNNEEHNADVMNKSKHQIRRQRRVESCTDDIFQRSLEAIQNGDDRTLRILCQSHFFLPSVTDEEGKTLLHHAAAQENPSICQVLLDTNIGMVNIDQQDKFGKTALHYAEQKGNPKTIKILLNKGAEEEIPDSNSKTVLDIALREVQGDDQCERHYYPSKTKTEASSGQKRAITIKDQWKNISWNPDFCCSIWMNLVQATNQ